mgnify:CR=1 FL=1|jgi:hypothetical protein
MIKTTTDKTETVADFLARGGKITHCAPKLAPKNPLTVHLAPDVPEPEELDDLERMVALIIKRHIGPY